ncbi:MAG: ABC transporter substrate-binding protein [Pseudomonadota bacterium]
MLRVLICLWAIAPQNLLYAQDLYLHKAAGIVNGSLKEAPILREQVAKGLLPPVEQRIPHLPHISDLKKINRQPGLYGGQLKMAMKKAKDTRQMVVYGYARLVVYNDDFRIEPDILLKVEVTEGRKFKLLLRPGHHWSDGHPFTSEDFRYWWEDIANHEALYPAGPPKQLLVGDELPKVSFPDPYQVVYEWSKPNPEFLPALAQATALYIYAPAHYLKKYHQNYQEQHHIESLVKQHRAKSWASLHNKLSKAYRNQNPELPSLQPWVLQPSKNNIRFIFKRNPWFHRVDSEGQQLPYIDEWVFNIVESKLIPLKASTGEVDLQSRYLTFKDIALLKSSEQEFNTRTYLWKNGKGAHLALMPNLNTEDKVWQNIFRDLRFRKALSMAINRREISRVIYFGLTIDGQNTLLPESPLYLEDYRHKWSAFDLEKANQLLDEMGLHRKRKNGLRRLEDGRKAEIIIEIADSGSEKADILSLIKDHWHEIGIQLYIKPVSLEVLRRRIFAGQTLMTLSQGIENGLAFSGSTPAELVPTSQIHYQWPKWGQYYETSGTRGQAPDIEAVKQLIYHYQQWRRADNEVVRLKAWREILSINAENIFTIGLLAGIVQPVTHRAHLRNVPTESFWNWNPGAHFGIVRPDLFWFDPKSS